MFRTRKMRPGAGPWVPVGHEALATAAATGGGAFLASVRLALAATQSRPTSVDARACDIAHGVPSSPADIAQQARTPRAAVDLVSRHAAVLPNKFPDNRS